MELIATTRIELGKKSRKVRKAGALPAVVFGKGIASLPITLGYNQFEKVYRSSGESTLVDLKLDGGEMTKVLISEVSYHPVTDKLIHANLHKVNLKEKISASVPLKIVGESSKVVGGEALLLTIIDEVTVNALPSDLPHDIQVDISNLTEIGQGIHIKDLPIDRSKVEIEGHDDEELVVKLDFAEMKEEIVEEQKTEEELVKGVEATEELTEEEKAEREKEKEVEKEKE